MGAENSNKMKKVPPASVAYTLLDFTEGEAGTVWSEVWEVVTCPSDLQFGSRCQI